VAPKKSENRIRAEQIWLESGGSIKLKDIASQIGVSDTQIRKWKNQDDWEAKLNGNVTDSNGNVTEKSSGNVTHKTPKNRGAPKNNKNALGNRGGAKKGNRHAVGNRGGAAPFGNKNAETHGFFSKIFPEEVLPVALDIMTKDPVDMLWENIIIQYTAIARAQKLMLVRSQDDETRVIKKQKGYYINDRETGEEKFLPEEIEWEYQHAWDKQATFLNAQSRAMTTLAGLTEKFMLLAGTDDKRRLELEKIIQSMETEKEKLKIEKEKLEVYRKQHEPSKENEASANWVESLKAIAERRRKLKNGEGDE
jgi:phage terminase small subunit